MRHLLFIIASCLPATADQYSTRIAHFEDGFSIHPEFLQRAKTNGYTHIMAGFEMERVVSKITDHTSVTTRLQPLKDGLTSAFSMVDQAGLKLIPRISLAAKWSRGWEEIWPSLEVNKVHDYWTKDTVSYTSTPFSPADLPMDSAFRAVLQTIWSSYQAASPSYALDYIGIGHDENYVQLSFAGNQPTLMIGFGGLSHSSTDRAYIAGLLSGSTTKQQAFQQIVVQEIYARLVAINDILPSETRALLEADMWDPQANGRIEHKTYHNYTQSSATDVVRLAPSHSNTTGVATLPSLNSTQKSFVRQKLVLMPWIYSTHWHNGAHRYDTKNTIDYFSHNGFKVIWASAATPKPDTNILAHNTLAVFNYTRVSSLYRNNVIGYAAMHWGGSPYHNPQDNSWKSMEYIRHISRPAPLHVIINY